MNCRSRFAFVGIAAAMTVACSLAFAQTESPRPSKDPKASPPKAAPPKDAGAGDHQLPPGWTEADMQACMEAGTPGEQHKHLTELVGTWQGKVTMWMAPGTEPVKSECTSVVSEMMDGRFTKADVTGDMPGMGPFTGMGLYGYDNTSEKFQATWICNCNTVIMNGVGELSSDKKALTWNFSYTCPVTKKPTTMREIETRTGKDSYKLESYGIDPKSGKEFKMMEIAFTRTKGAPAVSSAR